MLERRYISLRQRLARGLLRRLPRIVSDTVLYALVIYSVGCIIPTPLDQVPAHPNAGGPSFVSSNPNFGMITHYPTDFFDLTITVKDPDVGMADSQDEIWARLYRLTTGNVPVWNGEEIQLTGTDLNNPRYRSGSFASATRCQAFGLTGGATTDLYVIVSDRKFMPMTQIDTAGFTDTNHWDLTCL